MIKCESSNFAAHLMQPATEFNLVHSGLGLTQFPYQLGPRCIDDHLVYIIHQGEVRGEINGQEITINAQDLYWLPPGSSYFFIVPEEEKNTHIQWFRFHLQSGREVLSFEPDFLHSDNQYNTFHIAQELLPQNKIPHLDMEKMRLRSVLCQLFCLLSEQHRQRQQKGLLRANQKRAILNYVYDHLARRFTLKDIAIAVKMNPTYMSQQFTKTFGRSLQSYIKEARVKKAADLMLQQNLRVSEASEQLGYENPFLFSRQFKDVMGYSPREWLNQQDKDSKNK